MGMEKTPPTSTDSETISDLESKIIRQVEYYFGDYNYGRDRFLKGHAAKNDGWISLEVMVTFHRLKQLTEDRTVIATALKKSPNQLLEVNEEGTEIRRNPLKPLPNFSDDIKAEIESRSVYVKGFKADATLDELIELFKKYGNVENIQMRRIRKEGNERKRKFKGSVFATFKTLEEAVEFLEKKGIEYKGTALLKEKKKDYLERKKIEYEQRQKIKKERKEKGQAVKPEDENDNKEETADSKDEFVKGCLLKISGFSEDTMREHIREVLDPHGIISYVDFSKGEPFAVIRFESSVAEEVLGKVSKDGENEEKLIEINSTDTIAFVLKDEEEANYWNSIRRKSDKSKFYKKEWKNRGKGKGRNKRKFNDKGNDENSSAKKRKTEGETEEQSKNKVEENSSNEKVKADEMVTEA